MNSVLEYSFNCIVSTTKVEVSFVGIVQLLSIGHSFYCYNAVCSKSTAFSLKHQCELRSNAFICGGKPSSVVHSSRRLRRFLLGAVKTSPLKYIVFFSPDITVHRWRIVSINNFHFCIAISVDYSRYCQFFIAWVHVSGL